MNKFRGVLLLFIIVSLVLITAGCSNNRISELESQIASYQQDITTLKHYSRIKLYYDGLVSYNDRLLDDLQLFSEINIEMDEGLHASYINNELSSLKYNIDTHQESFDFYEEMLVSLEESSNINELDLLEDAGTTLSDMREIMLFLDDAYLVISDYPRLEIWNDDVIEMLDEIEIHIYTTMDSYKKTSSKSLEIHRLIQDF